MLHSFLLFLTVVAQVLKELKPILTTSFKEALIEAKSELKVGAMAYSTQFFVDVRCLAFNYCLCIISDCLIFCQDQIGPYTNVQRGYAFPPGIRCVFKTLPRANAHEEGKYLNLFESPHVVKQLALLPKPDVILYLDCSFASPSFTLFLAFSSLFQYRTSKSLFSSCRTVESH